MARDVLKPELLAVIAERFKTLGEPARLQLLQLLRARARTVTELVELTGMRQANVSKHLQLLHAHGYVARRKVGLHAWYSLADESVFRICDLMCSRLERDAAAQRLLIRAR
jgi:DNA-binding transcriptional ArsR family regulator